MDKFFFILQNITTNEIFKYIIISAAFFGVIVLIDKLIRG